MQHAKNLAAAEERSMKLYMEGNMPAAKGKKMLKPMTEVSPGQFLAAGAALSQEGRHWFLSLSVSRTFTTAIALHARNYFAPPHRAAVIILPPPPSLPPSSPPCHASYLPCTDRYHRDCLSLPPCPNLTRGVNSEHCRTFGLSIGTIGCGYDFFVGCLSTGPAKPTEERAKCTQKTAGR